MEVGQKFPNKEFLEHYSAQTRELVIRARQLIQEVMPDAIEMLDVPAGMIGYGID